MGFRKTWEISQTIDQLHACARQAQSPYNDGFTAWACKQDLYRVKFAVEEMLARTPTFSGEEEWLEEQEKQKVMRILKDGNTATRP